MTALFLGLVIGACVLGLAAELRTTRPSLAQSMAGVYSPRRVSASSKLSSGWFRSVAIGAVRRVGFEPWLQRNMASDCRVMGVDLEAHIVARMMAALAGLCVGPFLALVLSAAGAATTVILPVWIGLVAGVMGFVYPGMKVRAQAEKRRRSFVHALSAFLDGVAMRTAGGDVPEAAIADAASAGDGWAFGEIRHALYKASREGKTTWEGLSDLGTELRVRELYDLANTVQLSVEMGALLSQTMSDMSATVRHEILSDARADAMRATSRLGLANAALGLAFVLLVVYAAAEQIVFARP